jgi:hypothetical protein
LHVAFISPDTAAVRFPNISSTISGTCVGRGSGGGQEGVRRGSGGGQEGVRTRPPSDSQASLQPSPAPVLGPKG